MSSKTSSENNHPTWSEFFAGHPDDQEFKQALFVELYAQFNVNAKIISSENKMPILQAVVNYDGSDETVFDNPDALKKIHAINLIHRVFAEYRGLRYLVDEDNSHAELLGDIFAELLEKLDNIRQDVEVDDYILRLNRIESEIQAKYAAFLDKYILNH